MQDKNLILKRIKKLNLFTPINYFFNDGIDISEDEKKNIESNFKIELDADDCVNIFHISDKQLEKKFSGISFKASGDIEASDKIFRFVSGTYIFLQINSDYDNTEYFLSVIQEYMEMNNLKAENNILIQRLLNEDGKTISQFCIKIKN